uniref:Peptidase_M13 domain-containing protein n=1 Tax=Panagrellus redivivus TaxID=6233 RepID=A0A7E4W637_PANRE
MAFRSEPFGWLIEMQTDSEHDLFCFFGAADYFKMPLTQMFLQNSSFDVEVRPRVDEMVANIKEALHDSIRKATWLDEATRRNALRKAEALEYSVGYPENLFNDTFHREQYNITPSNSSEHFYAFLARVFRQQTTARLAQYELVVARMGFDVASPVIPNAYYSSNLNKMFLHMGSMQLPYFSPNLPDYVNYAGLGTTVGHELMHAFGIKARSYDHDGIKRNWWSNDSVTKYDSKMECFVKQYDGYGIDGRQTLEENMADNVGLMLAYNAYKKKHSKHPGYVESALPGLEKLTLDQIFFITAASTSCALDPSTGLNPNSPYTPEKLRIFGPLQNMKELSVAFNCSKDSNMNPKNRCSVW